ncbi:MAG: hypothetical protein Q6373_010405 [Candidatus Sigynarchaeota archaeon]
MAYITISSERAAPEHRGAARPPVERICRDDPGMHRVSRRAARAAQRSTAAARSKRITPGMIPRDARDGRHDDGIGWNPRAVTGRCGRRCPA